MLMYHMLHLDNIKIKILTVMNMDDAVHIPFSYSYTHIYIYSVP